MDDFTLSSANVMGIAAKANDLQKRVEELEAELTEK